MSSLIRPLGSLGFLLAAALAQSQSTVPDSLKPASNESLRLTLYARGVQIYRCEAGLQPVESGRWIFQAPDADLFSDPGFTQLVGRHFDGPSWEAQDHSRVTGKLRASEPAPTAAAIPWLLLSARPTGRDEGLFAGVRSIQRLDTVGGKPGNESCGASQAGAVLRLPYTAVYQFWGSAATAR